MAILARPATPGVCPPTFSKFQEPATEKAVASKSAAH
jgi:hypothetical protein